MPADTTYKSLPMTNRSIVRSLTANFRRAIYKSLMIAKKRALNGDGSPRRSFHGLRTSNAQAVQRPIADRLARNSGSDHSAISIVTPNASNVITY
ncbi:hypothetical protein RhiXN_04301 [Rhizoctonia solani]|uniref:Uncharacterized protein n=1 Tax=Rhizoctonia solani TaxID=456999 RepID=A0A8H8NN13_9AGAM|nr:uncharacterized protein RhiXN_04301 [Rhizoctonia solani]QRW16300.1 hypothetical protein RhiXN_04301 [Rhizoctonia solani]